MNRSKLLARNRRLRTEAALVKDQMFRLEEYYSSRIEGLDEENFGLRQRLEDNLTSLMVVGETFGRDANRYRRERDEAEAKLSQYEARNQWLLHQASQTDELLREQRREIAALEQESRFWQDKYLEAKKGS